MRIVLIYTLPILVLLGSCAEPPKDQDSTRVYECTSDDEQELFEELYFSNDSIFQDVCNQHDISENEAYRILEKGLFMRWHECN